MLNIEPCTTKLKMPQLSQSPDVTMLLKSSRSLPTTAPCSGHARTFRFAARAWRKESGIDESTSDSSKIGSQPLDDGALQSNFSESGSTGSSPFGGFCWTA